MQQQQLKDIKVVLFGSNGAALKELATKLRRLNPGIGGVQCRLAWGLGGNQRNHEALFSLVVLADDSPETATAVSAVYTQELLEACRQRMVRLADLPEVGVAIEVGQAPTAPGQVVPPNAVQRAASNTKANLPPKKGDK